VQGRLSGDRQRDVASYGCSFGGFEFVLEGSGRAERCGLCTMAAAERAPVVHAVKKEKASA